MHKLFISTLNGASFNWQLCCSTLRNIENFVDVGNTRPDLFKVGNRHFMYVLMLLHNCVCEDIFYSGAKEIHNC